MLELVANNTDKQVREVEHKTRIRMRRIEEILLTCFSVKRVQSLLCKSDKELNRARIKPRIKRLIQAHHDCRVQIVGNQSSLGIAYSRPLTSLERMRRRAAGGHRADDRTKHIDRNNKSAKRGL